MVIVLLILGIVFLFISISLHKSADEHETKFNQRPSIISVPSQDLMTNQKYAIINLLGFVLGTNAISAYNQNCNAILNQWMMKLGLSRQEVEKAMKVSMSFSPEKSVQIMRDSLCEIRDKDFIRLVFQDARKIATISDNEEIIYFIDEFSNDVLHS